MAEIKTDKIEREYVIPLRRQINKVPRYRKTEKAVKAVKEFLAKHMKVYDRDLNKIKIDKYLNEELWHRGIRNPPTKIKVKVIKEGDIVRVELAELPKGLKFKKDKEERASKEAETKKSKKTDTQEGTRERASTEEETKEQTEEQKKEQEEKKSALVEAGQRAAEIQHKQLRHEASGKQKGPRRQKRMALAK